MICEFCKTEYTVKWGSGKFCSRKCANAFSASKRDMKRIGKLKTEKYLKKIEEEKKIQNSIVRICKKCGKEYTGSWTPKSQSEFCSQYCAKFYAATIKRDEVSRKVSEKLKGRESIRKGTRLINGKYVKLKLEDLSSTIICPICGKHLSEFQIRKKRKTCSPDCAKKYTTQKLLASGHYTRNGGFRKRSVRSNYGYYKGIYCASTYELVYLIYSLDHNIPIERNSEYFEYEIDGVTKKYYPDFKINDRYIEIKNYHREEVDIKAESVLASNKELEILYYDDLEHMMCYIDEKYGTFHNRKSNNFQTLYDDHKPKFTFICEHCGKEVSTDNKRSKHRFCSKVCAAKHGHKNTLEFINKEDIQKELFPVPNYEGFWYTKDSSLYSSNFIRNDGKWLKCKLSFSNSGKPEYKIKGKRFSLEKLNKLCKFQN